MIDFEIKDLRKKEAEAVSTFSMLAFSIPVLSKIIRKHKLFKH